MAVKAAADELPAQPWAKSPSALRPRKPGQLRSPTRRLWRHNRSWVAPAFHGGQYRSWVDGRGRTVTVANEEFHPGSGHGWPWLKPGRLETAACTP